MSTPGPIPQNAADKSNHRVAFEREREVRFAVVMYGGVSLAIYINGIAQELLNLVRATAPKARRSNKALLSEKELTGASKVYRKLGQYLSIEDPKARLEKLTKSEVTDAPMTTQFVVDVISGTSAGGINGMFLAKALAQGERWTA